MFKAAGFVASLLVSIPVLADAPPATPAAAAAPAAAQPAVAPGTSATCAAIVSRTLIVDGRNDEWTNSHIKVKKGDIVLVTAEGKVKIGDWAGDVGAWGNLTADQMYLNRLKGAGILGDGTLVLKLGTGEIKVVGARMYWTADASGLLKFRVNDSDYSNNKGSLTLTIKVIPSTAIPAAQPVVASDDE